MIRILSIPHSNISLAPHPYFIIRCIVDQFNGIDTDGRENISSMRLDQMQLFFGIKNQQMIVVHPFEIYYGRLQNERLQ